jgi:hypothetical protein
MKTRLLAVAILALVSLGTWSAPAGAKTPTGNCAPPFTGPLTPKEVVKEFPPPPDLPDPEGAIASFDSNNDGTVCVIPLPNGRINVIDNVSNAP